MMPRDLRSPFTIARAGVTTAVMALAIQACAPPPAVPTRAGPTAGLSVCWQEKSEDEVVNAPLREAMRVRLTGAGYTLVSKRCDVRLHWRYTTNNPLRGQRRYTSATLEIRGVGSKPIDEVYVDGARAEATFDEPDRIAIGLVNAMNASAKLAAYAATRRGPPADDDAPSP